MFSFISARKAEHSVSRMCSALGVSESGHHAHCSRPASLRQREDGVLGVHIRAAFARSHESYGSPRIVKELQAQGVKIGRRRTTRLMRENHLNARPRQRFVRTTDSAHSLGVATNVLAQDFTADAPNQKWGVDITYIWTRQGWLYLAIVIDLYSRRVIGWATSDRMLSDLPGKALERALAIRQPRPGLIHHSDRGSQYCSAQYQNLLKPGGVIASMSRKGNCYDNAMVESFFKTVKSELVWKTTFMTRDQAKTAIARYIDEFYNPIRRHSALKYLSPVQFEKQNT
jgi:transposase InsO family protein